MGLYVTPTGGESTGVLIFNEEHKLSNISQPFCSYYTSGTQYSLLSTPSLFLSNINFSNVYSNLQFGLAQLSSIQESGDGDITVSPELTNYLEDLNSQILTLAYVTNCVTEQDNVTDALYSAEQSKKRMLCA
jgi:hypothetical protein